MITLYHHPLCAKSRFVRLALNEKKIEYQLVEEKFWLRRDEFLTMNPAAETPVMVLERGQVLSDAVAIIEYLEESYDARNLIGRQPLQKAETRRLVGWFTQKFHTEVTRNFVGEKYFRGQEGSTPNSKALSAGRQNVAYHLDYIDFLTKSHSWLNGDEMTFADLAAAAEISTVDYFGDVPWAHNERAKHWYAVMKSRPSFRTLLEDRVPGVTPPAHYNNPDF